MDGTVTSNEQAADRLVAQLLQDAYCEVAAVLMSMNPKAATGLFYVLEKRIADALARISATGEEGAGSAAITLAVGAQLCAVMDRAHGRDAQDLAA